MPRTCPVHDHITDFGGPRLASQKLYPTKREFILALWECQDSEANCYWLTGYGDTMDSGDCLTLEESEIHEEWVRGCVCASGAYDLADPSIGHYFHWEAGGGPTHFKGMIKCWRYGDWY